MKPEEHIQRVISAVSEQSRIATARDRQMITLTQFTDPMTLILHDGTASVFRSRDHLLVKIVKAPMLLGANILAENNMPVYLKSIGYSRYEILPRALLSETVKREHLWESIAHIIMFNYMHAIDLQMATAGASSYELICNNLVELMHEEEEICNTITACEYIQQKTKLSRSNIMKVLGELKKGEYITLKRGVLLSINKLPTQF